jgi:predicted hydrocarbon binding protein
LGDFSSVVFLKGIVIGLEESIGEKTVGIALIAAGRNQGKKLAEELGLVNDGASLPIEEIQEKINHILGKDGARLCLIDKLEQEGDSYKAYTKETFCSAGEVEGSLRKCTYTLGIIQGVLETFLGKRLRGQQSESVLRGGTHDVMEFQVLS